MTISVVAHAKECDDLLGRKQMNEEQLKRHIAKKITLNPRQRNFVQFSWNSYGEVFSLTATLEVLLPGESKPSEIGLYGYPFRQNGSYYVYYKVLRDSANKDVGGLQPKVERIKLDDLDKLRMASLFDYPRANNFSQILIPHHRKFGQLMLARYISHDRDRIVLELPGGERLVRPRALVETYYHIFRDTGELEIVKRFFQGGGKGYVVLYDSRSSLSRERGVYIVPTRWPAFNAATYRDPHVFEEILSKVSGGVGFIIVGRHLEFTGAHMPAKHHVVQFINDITGLHLENTIVVHNGTDASTIIHEYQHFLDAREKTLSPFISYIMDLDMRLPRKNLESDLDFQDLTVLYSLILEQRAYAAQMNWLRNHFAKLQGQVRGFQAMFSDVSYEEFAAQKIESSVAIFKNVYLAPAKSVLDRIKAENPKIYDEILDFYAALAIDCEDLNLLALLN